MDPEDPRFQAFSVGFGQNFDEAETNATTVSERFSTYYDGAGYEVLLRERWSGGAGSAREGGERGLPRSAEAAAVEPIPSANTRAEPRAGEMREFAGMEFVWVPPGEFVMGSESGHAYSREQPLTRVRISRGYWLGRYEVTQGQWRAVMGNNPSSFDECGLDWPGGAGFVGGCAGLPAGVERARARAWGAVPIADGSGVGVRGTCGDSSRDVRGKPDRSGGARPCAGEDCMVRREQWESHAASGSKGTECVGTARHVGERLGSGCRIGMGPIREAR